MVLREKQIVDYISIYLKNKGWNLQNIDKTVSEHGVDIKAFHPKWRKIYLIEVKGETNNHQHQTMHNAFWVLLGQILTRMDKEGNKPNRARFYAIGIPKKWEIVFRNKINNMKFGWKLLRLKVFLVYYKGKVEEKSYSYFLS